MTLPCVSLGTVVTGTINGGSDLTLAVDAGANDNRFLLVYLLNGTFDTITATYGGQSLNTYGSNTFAWYLVNPPAGVNNLVVHLANTSTHAVVAALPFSYVHQETPLAYVHWRQPQTTATSIHPAEGLTPHMTGLAPQQTPCDYWVSNIQIIQQGASGTGLPTSVVLDTSGGLGQVALLQTSGGTTGTQSKDALLGVAVQAGGAEPSILWTLDQSKGTLLSMLLVRSENYRLAAGWHGWGWAAGGEAGTGWHASGEEPGDPAFRGFGRIWGAPTQMIGLANTCEHVHGGSDATAGFRADTPGVVAWGANDWWELGDGSTSFTHFSDTPEAVSLPGGATAKKVAGYQGNIFVVGTDGTLYGTGHGGNPSWSSTGVAISASYVVIPGISNVADIDVSFESTIVVKDDGTVWVATQDNWIAGLNNSSTTHPTTGWHQVAGLANITQARLLADSAVMALDSAGAVWTWGNDGTYLGRGSGVTSTWLPAKVTGLPAIEHISANEDSMVVFGTDGTCWGWGNDYGAWGSGVSAGGALSPTPVRSPTWPAGHRVAAVTSAPWQELTIAALDDGTLWGTGRENNHDISFDGVGSPGEAGNFVSWTRMFPQLYADLAAIDVVYHFTNGPMVRALSTAAGLRPFAQVLG